MSRSATEELVRARKMYKVPIVGETLSAALGCDGITNKHSCFQHAAGHLLSPPLRPDATTPTYLMQALARYVSRLFDVFHLIIAIFTVTISN